MEMRRRMGMEATMLRMRLRIWVLDISQCRKADSSSVVQLDSIFMIIGNHTRIWVVLLSSLVWPT